MMRETRRTHTHDMTVSTKRTDVKKGRTPDHATQEPVRAPGTRLKSSRFIRGHAATPSIHAASRRRSLLASCTQITSAANQTSVLALRNSGHPARTSRRCGCTAQIARMGRQVLYTSITPAGKILLLALPNPFETATSNTTNPTCMC
jgi:hypothetical protein